MIDTPGERGGGNGLVNHESEPASTSTNKSKNGMISADVIQDEKQSYKIRNGIFC